MNTKMELLERARLYCVLDAGVLSYDQLFDVLRCSADAGVDVFQIRDKDGADQDIAAFTRKCMAHLSGEKLFIVNDRINVALEAGADGVHIGQEDDAFEAVCDRGGEDFMIGVSCQSLAHAREAQRKGADYIGFGSVFKTLTKPQRDPMDLKVLASVLQEISIPVFPIGGISLENCKQVTTCGAQRIAVTRAICLAKDIQETVRTLRYILMN